MKEPKDELPCYEKWTWGHWMTVDGPVWDYAFEAHGEWILDNGFVTEPVDETFLLKHPEGL